jgi:hypothetical protein
VTFCCHDARAVGSWNEESDATDVLDLGSFILFVLVILALDTGVFHRTHVISIREALG